MSLVIELASSDSPCRVEGLANDQVSSVLWFKSKPVHHTFCRRATQLQLCADSHDKGHSDIKTGSWFELVILSDAEATTPRIKHGNELAWRSHKNVEGSSTESRHFGVIFDRRQGLLNELEVGNVVAVRICAKNPGAVNNAIKGSLVAKLVTEDLFSYNSWTLSSLEDNIPASITSGVYSITSTNECEVYANDNGKPNTLSSRIWFSTPALDANVVAKIEEIQLHTDSRDQGFADHPEAGSWSWFDIIILESPEATTPRVKDGRSLVWLSHTNNIGQGTNSLHGGAIFDRNDRHPELLNSLEVGNVIAVRVCAQFAGWENHAQDGHLVVRISNTGSTPRPMRPTVDWEAVTKRNVALKTQLDTFLNNSTPSDAPPVYSVVTQLLSEPLRADQNYGAGERPLRLLSLDGGGVRGISSLEILRAIMAQVSSDPNAKPCDYFDMMAGTSTGGLIAVMLGRLQMTVQECITAYYKMAETIFAGNSIQKAWATATTGACYSGEVLEKAIKSVVKDKLGDENAMMLDPGVKNCKLFVAACRADNLSNQIATHLRTYVNRDIPNSHADCKIWEACRATSAAPTYFPRIKIGDCEYVDGGLGFNNPVLLLLAEAASFFGQARPIGCLLTLGTGMAPNVDLGSEGTEMISRTAAGAKLVEAVISLSTNSETTNGLAMSFAPKDAFFRFNAGVKLYGKTGENWADTSIAMDDHKDMAKFVGVTDKYLEGETARIAQCALKVKA